MMRPRSTSDLAMSQSTTDTPANLPEKTTQAGRYAGIVEVLTTVVLLGGPLFYVLGRIYWESYWLGLGISPSVMAVEAEDYIYYGFVVLASGIIMLFPHLDFLTIWAAPLASTILILLLAGVILVLTKAKRWIVKRLRKIRPKLRSYYLKRKPALDAIGIAADVLSAVSTWAMVLLLVSVGLLLPIVIAHAVGKERAAKVSADLAAPKTPYTQVQVDGKTISTLVECTEKFCVIYEKGHLRPVPVDAVQWLPATASKDPS